jgi:hypothetical protein
LGKVGKEVKVIQVVKEVKEGRKVEQEGVLRVGATDDIDDGGCL